MEIGGKCNTHHWLKGVGCPCMYVMYAYMYAMSVCQVCKCQLRHFS